MIFRNRQEAGRSLAWRLQEYAGRDDVLVLGVPRGGIPVAFEIAEALRAPLDVFIVRKLGIPGREEVALGAIASGGVRILDRRILRVLAIDLSKLERIIAEAEQELKRRELIYRGVGPPVPVAERTVILVDDGVATGSSLLAGIRALRQLRPARIILAVPVAPPEVCNELSREVDEMVCVATPKPFRAVGQFYDDFSQVHDEEVIGLLSRNRQKQSKTAA